MAKGRAAPTSPVSSPVSLHADRRFGTVTLLLGRAPLRLPLLQARALLRAYEMAAEMLPRWRRDGTEMTRFESSRGQATHFPLGLSALLVCVLL